VTLERKKLGILGFGRIGRELASIACGFRMEIHYRDLDRLPPELEQGATYHDHNEDFLRTIDVLSMHVPRQGGDAKMAECGAARHHEAGCHRGEYRPRCLGG
jgi:lactate dehydrogenase-like 2-hydroxyacid dehydrogenase